MTDAQLAAAIERLDWSHTSLQHQLVMSAAVLALRGEACEGVEVENPSHDAVGPILSNPVGEMQNLLADLVNIR